eukprot:1302648-Rhodomonas_salina.1
MASATDVRWMQEHRLVRPRTDLMLSQHSATSRHGLHMVAAAQTHHRKPVQQHKPITSTAAELTRNGCSRASIYRLDSTGL